MNSRLFQQKIKSQKIVLNRSLIALDPLAGGVLTSFRRKLQPSCKKKVTNLSISHRG